MRKLCDAFLRMSPDEEQRARMLENIQLSAAVPARRLPLKKILAIAAAAALCTATVVFAAVPAVKTYFVPHLGLVEVPETTAAGSVVSDDDPTPALPAVPEKSAPTDNPYMFLHNVTGEVSGNTYTVGYVFGDTAVLYVKSPTDTTHDGKYASYDADTRGALLKEAAEQARARLSEEGEVISCTPYGTPQGVYTESEIHLTGLDAAVAQQGLSFMGDTLFFTALGAEYTVLEQTFHGVTVQLLPLSEDNTAFYCLLESAHPEILSVAWEDMTARRSSSKEGFFAFRDENGCSYPARLKGNLLLLEEEPDTPVVALTAECLEFQLKIQPFSFTADVAPGLETSYTPIDPPLFADQLSLPVNVSVSVVREEDYPNSKYRNMLDFYTSRWPTGMLTLSSEAAVLAGGEVKYWPDVRMERDYSDLLQKYRETRPAQYSFAISNGHFGYQRTVPWFDELGDRLNLTVSAVVAAYSCDWNFPLPH